MSNTIAERERAIIEEFAFFDDWMSRYEFLIEQGRSLPPLEASYRTDAYRVQGCQSQVWVRPAFEEDRVYFEADSDAQITRGLVALLVRVLSGQKAADIAAARLEFVSRIGLDEHLSPTRKNGLDGMIRLMKRYALEHAARNIENQPTTTAS